MARRKPTGDLFLPLSRATVQMWGVEQSRRPTDRERPVRRPLRAAVRWIAAALRH
jgi:hypothetical protein